MGKQTSSIIENEYVSWFLYLPRGTDRLENLGVKKRFPKNYLLAEAGNKTKYCYIVISGRVISCEYSESGEERIYCVNESNSILLEENLLFGYNVPLNVRTAADSDLICINRGSLLTAICEDSEIAVDLMQSLSMKTLSSMEQMRCMNELNAVRKVCNLFLILAERYGAADSGGIVIREKLSQEYISSLLGLNRITVVRVMKSLKEQGVIQRRNGCYWISDVELCVRIRESS